MALYRVVEDNNHTFLIHEDRLDYYRSKDNCDVYALVEYPLDGAPEIDTSTGSTTTKLNLRTSDENN